MGATSRARSGCWPTGAAGEPPTGEPAHEALRHDACGTPLEARWYCPTCERSVADRDVARDPFALSRRCDYALRSDHGRPALGTRDAGARPPGRCARADPAAEPPGTPAPLGPRGRPDAAPAATTCCMSVLGPDLRRDRDHGARARRAARQPARQAVRADRAAAPASSPRPTPIVRIWRSAWAWMPVDRGKGSFRLAWVVVSVIGLTALRRGRPPRADCVAGHGRTSTAGRDGRSTRPRRRVGGVPRWMAASLNFCPRCGSALCVRGQSPARTATACRAPPAATSLYVNPRLVVTTLPGHRCRRDRADPARHRARAWANGRSPAASSRSTRRSTRPRSARRCEETGLLVEPGEIVGLYTRLEAAVVTIVFEAADRRRDADADARGDRDPGLSPPRPSPGPRSRSARRPGRCATGSSCADPDVPWPERVRGV